MMYLSVILLNLELMGTTTILCELRVQNDMAENY